MSIVSVLVKKLAGLVFAITAVFKRMLCFLHIVRRRKNSGSLLPMTTDQTVLSTGEPQQMQSLPSNDYEELESWDSWGNNDVSGFSQSTGMSQNHASNHRLPNHHHRNKANGEVETEPDVDFFQDMVPEVKKPAKILIRKKEEHIRPAGLSSRLNMTAAVPTVTQGSELEQWDETESAWSSEALEDLSWQAENALKDSKHRERLQRQEEQQRKKIQKELERKQKRDGLLSAVKLS